MLHAIIMAGGSGSRLWPESRANHPKQLLKIGADTPLIRQSVDRIRELIPPERIYLSTNARLAKALLDAVEVLPPESAIVEPAGRNTAACIALAAVHCLKKDPDATMVILTSDHRIAPEEDFQNCVIAAAKLVEQDPTRLITFGIVPRWPSESYGYIHRCSGSGEIVSGVNVYKVKEFKEKPSRDVAESFLKDGHYFWNSGMFVWKAQTILDNIAQFEPELGAAFDAIAKAWDSDPETRQKVLTQQFTAMKSISIDYAVMERSSNVSVVEASFDWDDIGSWTSLERLSKQDEQGNTIQCKRYVCVDTEGTIVRCSDPNHLIATVGVRDLAIIETPSATLVINKKNEEAVRKAVEQIKENDWTQWL